MMRSRVPERVQKELRRGGRICQAAKFGDDVGSDNTAEKVAQNRNRKTAETFENLIWQSRI